MVIDNRKMALWSNYNYDASASIFRGWN